MIVIQKNTERSEFCVVSNKIGYHLTEEKSELTIKKPPEFSGGQSAYVLSMPRITSSCSKGIISAVWGTPCNIAIEL